MFNHMMGVDLPEMNAVMTDVGRFYTTPDGNRYPSVTTVLSAGTDNTWKAEWIARVGQEEADRVSKKATNRGTAVHELVEKYLRNDPVYTKGHMPANILSFKNIKPFLDEHLGTIAGLEIPLYSDKLKVAGRVDCIAEWDGVWSIVDFKTSKKEKKKEDITNYFLQCSAYSYMFYERTGLMANKIVIVMTVDDGKSLIFEEKASNFLDAFSCIRNSINF